LTIRFLRPKSGAMKRAKQLSLFKDPRKDTKLWWIKKQSTYGGSLEYRKVARPFDSKKLTHAVFAARTGTALRFTKSTQSILKLIDKAALKCRVKIKDIAVNHDHIHLLFYSKRRAAQILFLRYFAAEMGRKYKKLRKAFGVSGKTQFWRSRPFTRLVSWGRKSLAIVRKYIRKNREEALGFVEYGPRKHRLSQFLKNWSSSFQSGSG
jgi:REP element-mobilizing transposase RayT